MWSVKRVAGSDSTWIVYKDKKIKGAVSVLDLDFSGDIDIDPGDNTVDVINHIEDLIASAIAEEQLLMSN